MTIRPAAVAGTWYPGTPGALTQEVDAYLGAATAVGRMVMIELPVSSLQLPVRI